MIEDVIDHAEEDLQAAQVALARVDADAILLAIEKAKRNDAWLELTDAERQQIDDAIRQLQTVYHGDDHHAIREQIDRPERSHAQTRREHDEHRGQRSALKGTKV